ncbi:hypothetical protein SAMN05216327_101278 [Dyadobacter sp. SG02]|uniref:prealbumin-like fold domain-containing protein n=1 Tax=Dyadobacter sp. SG02 TaxID=1855291 RepID=UPI0008B574B0|nr:prealbumin-like fold domain-containing protein [Dyadobacter sp. SG02]SEI40392.1 hypothetical protein SAMN05216327_101278 [Dyadobacter sp. SG02]
MRTTLFLIALSLFLFACHGDDVKFYEEKDLTGRLILKDELTGISGGLASEATVYLSAGELKSINDKFLYSTKADKEGIFTFSNQPRDQGGVWLTAKYTASNGIVYQKQHALASLPPANAVGEMEIKLNPVYPKGVLKVIWKNTDEPVVGAEVYLFANSNQATTISNETPDGHVQKGTTNANGIALFYGLDVGTYYVAGRTKAGGTIALADPPAVRFETADVDGQTKSEKSVTLAFPDISPEPSIDVTATIGAKEPLARFYVYLFTSEEQAKTIHDRRVNGYVMRDSTDVNGTVSLKNLEQKKYYVGIRGLVGGNIPKSDYRSIVLTGNTVFEVDFEF